MRLRLLPILITLGLVLKTGCVLATTATSPIAPSLGGMAQSMLVPISALAQLFYKMFYILGAAMIVGSGVQYKAHRDNPSQIPINRPIFLLVVGLVLIAVPLIAQLSASAASVSTST